MAEFDQESDRDMTPGEQLIELFGTVPPPGGNLDWYADRLLNLATATSALVIELVPDLLSPDYNRSLRVEDDGRVLDGGRPRALRAFRPLLARLAVIGAQESRTEFQPYGGRYSLVRPGPTGPVRLDIDFSNTTVSQRLSITRVSIAPTAVFANDPPVEADSASSALANDPTSSL